LCEKSVVVYRGVESVLTPLMLDIERRFQGVKVFSLPSEDHPVHGRHIDLGVKGAVGSVEPAFDALIEGLSQVGASIGPTVVR
jgi:molybdopterin-biosynthesis enzyme MoeA-like protein